MNGDASQPLCELMSLDNKLPVVAILFRGKINACGVCMVAITCPSHGLKCIYPRKSGTSERAKLNKLVI